MKVKNGSNVNVHYKGTLNDGSEFDNSRTRGQTLDFEVGSGRMIPGFDNALIGMSKGQTKKIKLEPESAYGYRMEDAVRPVPRSAFGEDFEFQINELIQGNGPNGPFIAKIEEVFDDRVILDFNHPLAGKELNFEIELVSVDAAAAAKDTVLSSWRKSMKKAELLEVATNRGITFDSKVTKAKIIEALETT